MKHLSLLIMTALLGLVTLSSCQKEENTPQQTQEAKFIYASQVENAFQLTPLADLAEGVQTSFDNSQTLPVGHLFLEKYGDYIYAMSGSMFGYGGEQGEPTTGTSPMDLQRGSAVHALSALPPSSRGQQPL